MKPASHALLLLAGALTIGAMAMPGDAEARKRTLFSEFVQGPIQNAIRSAHPTPKKAVGTTTVKKKPIKVAKRRPSSISAGVTLASFSPEVVFGGATALPPPVVAKVLPATPSEPAVAPPIAESEPAEASPPPVAVMPPASAVPLPPERPEKPDVRYASLSTPHDEPPFVSDDTLKAMGMSAKPVDAISDGDCTITQPVAVASLDEGAIKFSAKATLNREMARVFALWIDDDVAPAAHDLLKKELTGVRVLASYDCRPRDNVKGALISEHAFGNAIDIGAFEIGDEWLEVGAKNFTPEEDRFMDAVRYAACKRFTTVLGPGEAYHDTHFHLDLARHGKTGKYRLCQ